jgi:hypothetical protein
MRAARTEPYLPVPGAPMAGKSSPNFGRIVFRIAAGCALVSLVVSLRTVRVEIGTAATAVHPRSGAAARNAEAVHYNDTALELLAVYRVLDGQLEAGVPAEHARLWTIAEATLPASARQQIRQLNVVTDGTARTLAMVHRSTTEHDAWILSIDPAESDEVLQRTLVHELAHLFTLGEKDLTAQRTNCNGRLIEIGCAQRDSLLASYADEFWAGRPEPERYRSSEFVTQYAAESVHEDLAETFMFWVYGEDPASPSIAAKYEWFSAHDVFVAARDDVRFRLS